MDPPTPGKSSSSSTAPRRSARNKRPLDTPLQSRPSKVTRTSHNLFPCTICPQYTSSNVTDLSEHMTQQHPDAVHSLVSTAAPVRAAVTAQVTTAGPSASSIAEIINNSPLHPKNDPKKPTPPPPPPKEEKRPKRWRKQPPLTLNDRLYRCQTQKMFVLDRTRDDDALVETFKIAGSTGNVYTVRICGVPVCDCPDGQRNGTCKHILYIMSKVLRAPDHLVYQSGLLRSELAAIFAAAPSPSSSASARKPLEQDDCPICYCGFEPGEATVYCKARCGTNLHKSCFEQWARTKGSDRVTCPMCRELWAPDGEVAREVLGRKEVGPEGYVNVAGELGMSGVRDRSTYHQFTPRYASSRGPRKRSMKRGGR